jgi:hypothetical protein
MLIKTTILILAIAATLVTGSVIGAQLTYAQQGSSTNPNFKVLEITSSPPRYKVAIPVDWIGPTLPYNNPGDVYFHSPDGSKGVLVSFRFPGFYRIEDFISAEIQNSASNGKSPIQDLQAVLATSVSYTSTNLSRPYFYLDICMVEVFKYCNYHRGSYE